jgi:hypothetical protein
MRNIPNLIQRKVLGVNLSVSDKADWTALLEFNGMDTVPRRV